MSLRVELLGMPTLQSGHWEHQGKTLFPPLGHPLVVGHVVVQTPSCQGGPWRTPALQGQNSGSQITEDSPGHGKMPQCKSCTEKACGPVPELDSKEGSSMMFFRLKMASLVIVILNGIMLFIHITIIATVGPLYYCRSLSHGGPICSL